MKTIFILFLFLGAGSCVEFKCYSDQDYAINGAKEFCNQGNGKKELCESLKIYDKNICSFEKYTKDACRPLGDSIDIFARIPFPDCMDLDKKTCKEKDFCRWTFKDPIGMKFSDF